MGEWRAHQRDRPTLRHEIYRVGQKRGHRLMTLILSILNRLKNISPEDSLVNLQLNRYQKSHRTLHMLLHYLVKHVSKTSH